MKRVAIIAVSLLLICGAIFYYISVPRSISDITAESGVLNLTGAPDGLVPDFSETHFHLDGEWEFYYGEFYAPEDFVGLKIDSGELIQAPMSWDKAGFPLRGFATYRLTILTDEPELMMLIPEISDSSIVWINGKKVFEAGRPGMTEKETISSVRNAFVTFRPENGQAEIVIQAANYGWFSSGLRYSIEIGRSDVLFGDAMIRRVLLGIGIGILLAMFLYHIILFTSRCKEWVYLAFALTCLIVSVRLTVETNGLAQLFLPDGVGEGLTSLMLALLVLQSVALTAFTHIVFAIPIKRGIRSAIYAAAWLIPLVIIFIVPYGSVNMQFVYIAMLPMLISAVSAARSKRLRENPYNLLFLFAFVIFILWYPFTKIILRDTLFMPGVATNLFLLFSQCVVLTESYVEAKRKADELAAKTDFWHNIAHNILTPLTEISTNVQVARIIPEEADELLEESQKKIMETAAMINDALVEAGGDRE